MEKSLNKEFLNKFGKSASFTTRDVFAFYRSFQPHIHKKTVNWRIYELIHGNALQRLGRGVYSTKIKNTFKIVPDKKLRTLATFIKAKFPFISFCVWNTSRLSEFFQHVTNLSWTIIEVEREGVEAVYHSLNESYKTIFREPSRTVIEDFILKEKDAVILLPLKSESPLQEMDGVFVPELEKILVDLYAERDLFFFIQGKELPLIIQNAIEKYSINYDRLFRYASRRGKKEELKPIINQIVGKL